MSDDGKFVRDDTLNDDLLDMLLDGDNTDRIFVYDSNGKRIEFEQVAVIPHNTDGDTDLYCILKPITKMEGVADDEAIVFKVIIDSDGNAALKAETSASIAIEIFEEYYNLIEKELKRPK